jgi:hypothetical protein
LRLVRSTDVILSLNFNRWRKSLLISPDYCRSGYRVSWSKRASRVYRVTNRCSPRSPRTPDIH